MKKHMKKWLALAMAAVMLFAMAIPAMAAEEDDTVTVTVMLVGSDILIGSDITIDSYPISAGTGTTVTMKAERATALAALKAAEGAEDFEFPNPYADPNFSVDFTFNRDNGLKDVLFDGESVNETIIPGEMKSCSWAVAVNGRRVEGDLGAITLADEDEITVYLYDSFMDTKLVQADASNIAAGIISFYYYDAEGNQTPFCGVRVQLIDNHWNNINNLFEPVDANPNFNNTMNFQSAFPTDERGQIWIAPQYLGREDGLEIHLQAIGDKAVVRQDGYNKTYEEKGIDGDWYDTLTEEEQEYVDAHESRAVEYLHLYGEPLAVVSHDTYNVAGATGDMTVVYVLIGAAALFTLGAVIMWKTKKRIGAE